MTMRRWVVILPLLVIITTIVGVLGVSAHGSYVGSYDKGTWMPWWVTVPYDAYFNRGGLPWVQVHQHFYWDQDRLTNFKNLNADFQWELNRRGNEYWDYWYCVGYSWDGIYWTDLPDHTDEFSEEQDPPHPCMSVSGDEEFEVKSKDQDALQPYTAYAVYAEFRRDIEDLGRPLNYQTEAEYCGDSAPLCDWGQTFKYGLLTIGVFANP